MAQPIVRLAVLAVVALASAGACGQLGGATSSLRAPATPPGAPTPGLTPRLVPSAAGTPSPRYDLEAAEIVASNLEVPWGLDFTPDGDALVSERETGRVLRIRAGQAPVEVARIDDAVAVGEGGLLGLAVSPGHATDGLVYVFYNTGTESRIARFSLGEAAEVVVSGITAEQFHTGGRIAFGPDGRLYATVGDATDGDNAQDPSSLAGKILRYEADGSIPADNPDPASAVWSLGHRNLEGLAWDAEGRLWATEFGEAALDELNLIEPGGNYGWPRFEGPGNDAEFIDPLVTWTPERASPAGIAFAEGGLWIAALRGERMWMVPLVDGVPGTPVSLLEGRFGRLRTVELAPDGSLWLATSNRDGRGEPVPDDDRLIRIPLAPAP